MTSPGLESELRALGSAGASGSFTIPCPRGFIEVALVTDEDGHTTSLTLSVDYDRVTRVNSESQSDDPPLVATRPLSIRLRRERPRDVVAKQTGLAVEWQSLDDDFDRTVYVSTPSDPSVLAKVLGPEVRRSVRALIEIGFDCVSIDVKGRIEACIPASHLDPPEAEGTPRGPLVLAAFKRLLDHLPVVHHSGQTRAPRPLSGMTMALGLTGLIGSVLNAGYVGLTGIFFRTMGAGAHEGPTLPPSAFVGLLAWAVVIGAVGSKLYRRAVAERIRGCSDAHEQVGRAGLAAFGGFGTLAFTVAFTAVILWLG